jgi:hypothetical protein
VVQESSPSAQPALHAVFVADARRTNELLRTINEQYADAFRELLAVLELPDTTAIAAVPVVVEKRLRREARGA